MEITAAMVKKLRDTTGAGMMECKAALTEAKGDMEEATTILRKRGLAQAGKKAGRSTNEGLIGSRLSKTLRASAYSSGVLPARSNGVSIEPGPMALTRMP